MFRSQLEETIVSLLAEFALRSIHRQHLHQQRKKSSLTQEVEHLWSSIDSLSCNLISSEKSSLFDRRLIRRQHLHHQRKKSSLFGRRSIYSQHFHQQRKKSSSFSQHSHLWENLIFKRIDQIICFVRSSKRQSSHF